MGQELRDKIVASIKDFKNLSHPICYSEAANQANIEQFLLALFHTRFISMFTSQVIGKYKEMVCLITSYEEMAFKGWTESVEALTTENLEEPLLIREETGLLRVNFGKHLMATLIEVKHLQKDFKLRVVPQNVKKLFLRYVKFRNSKNILDQTVTR